MEPLRVLVAHGSRHGSTAEIAEWVGTALGQEGLSVDVRPAAEVSDVEPYDAVVVGGALYAMRWHPAARRFIRQHRRALAVRPVWLFSSGPLDRSAEERDIPPVRGVRRASARVGARGHATFGGRLTTETPGFIAQAMAKKVAGDYRSLDQINAWARDIASLLRTSARSERGDARTIGTGRQT
jgi:menaquinone-dependent protoporphyrinogen oxidase